MRNFFVVSFLLICNVTTAQNNVTLQSPNQKIKFSFSLINNKPKYSVTYKNQLLIKYASLNLLFNNDSPLQNCSLIKSTITHKAENYNLTIGKTSSVSHSYTQAIIYLQSKNYQINIEIKLFNDGVGFRYLFPQQKNKTNFTLLDEQTEFNIVGNPIVKVLQLPSFTTSHEGLYTTVPLNEITNDTLIDMPALFQFRNNIYMAITEAALIDYAGMYLIKRNGILTSQLSPLPKQNEIKVKAKLPHVSPWRVLMIGKNMGTLIQSNILTSLCPPLVIKDVSWIKPSTTTFPWWNGTIIPDSVKGGNNFETNKYYIDFCAANNIKYHTVVEYGGHEWYTNDGEGYQPGKYFDITKPVDGLNMKEVCDYAKSKGVGVRVWTHWKALYPKLDTAFALFEQWGLSGMMVDFMDRDDQEMVNIQTEILQKAATYHLTIQFHGAYKPTGLVRTYPNEFTREGAMNYEYNKWDKIITPKHDLDIVFTRALAGSTDYHLGGFRSLPFDKFVAQNSKPYVMGTRCHMLAMYVVLENEQGMMCDEPNAYINEPGFEVLQQMPVTWDETKVPAAEMDKYVCIARRKGKIWYIGSITNNDAREIRINLNFLNEGKYTATIYSDAEDANENANHLIKEIKMVDKKTILNLKLAKGGGNFIKIDKAKN